MSLSGRHVWGLACVVLHASWSMGVARADEPPAAPGDGDIDPGVNLDRLLNLRVVTASGGLEEERSLAPASVVVFNRDDIARQGWRSLTDVLQNTPGMDVVDDQVMPSVGVRGVTGGFRASTRIVKVMIDGVAVIFAPTWPPSSGPNSSPSRSSTASRSPRARCRRSTAPTPSWRWSTSSPSGRPTCRWPRSTCVRT